MTKIKNTKKGMAKKTLSISLVAAMLATSNVPVWADEFSDGTDAAFTSEAAAPQEVTAPEVTAPEAAAPEVQAEEAPVAEETETVQVATASSTVYDDTKLASFKLATAATEDNPTNGEWGTEIELPEKALTYRDSDTAPKGTIIAYWTYNGLQIGDQVAEVIENNDDIGTAFDKIASITPTKEQCIEGGDFGLYLYVRANGADNFEKQYNFGPARAVDLTKKLEDVECYKKLQYSTEIYDGKEHKATIRTNDNVVISNITVAPNDKITVDDIKWDFVRMVDGKNNLVDSTVKTGGKKVDVTAQITKPGYTGKYTFEQQYEIQQRVVTQDTITAVPNPSNFEYTGAAICPDKSQVIVKDSETGDDLSGCIEKIWKNVGEKEVGKYPFLLKFELTNANSLKNDLNYKVDDGNEFKSTSDFAIVKRDLSKCTVEYPEYSKGELDAIIRGDTPQYGNAFKFGEDGDGSVLKDAEGEVLDALYSELTRSVKINSAGDYILTITGKNDNFVNKKEVNLSAPDISLRNYSVYLKDKTTGKIAEDSEGNKIKADKETVSVAYTGKPYRLSKNDIILYNEKASDGERAITDSLYDLEYDDRTDAGLGTVIVKGKGSYTGSSLKFNYTVRPASIESYKAAKEVVYDPAKTEASDYAPDMDIIVKAVNDAMKNKPEAAKSNDTFTLTADDLSVSYEFFGTIKDRDGLYNCPGNFVEATVTIKNDNFKGITSVENEKNDNLAQANWTFEVKSEIVKPSIGDRVLGATVEILNKDSYVFNGKEILPDVKVTAKDGSVLKEGVDYRVDVKHGLHAGQAEVVITALEGKDGKGQYRVGSENDGNYFTIHQADIKNVYLKNEVEYTGEKIFLDGVNEPDVFLKNADGTEFNVTPLFSEKTATSSYANNLNAGKASVTINVLKEWEHDFTAPSADVTFEITPVDVDVLDDALFLVYNEKSHIIDFKAFEGFTYDGTAKTFKDAKISDKAPTIKLNKKNYKLVKDKDYVIGYANNINPDQTGKNGKTAYIYVKLSDNFRVVKDKKGTVADPIVTPSETVTNVLTSHTYRINKLSIEDAAISVEKPVYNDGKKVTPSVKVTYNGKALEEGKDYVLEFAENDSYDATETDEKTVVVKGINGYVGSSKEAKWGINKKDINSEDIKVELDKTSYKPGEKPQVTVIAGKTILDTDEYTIAYTDVEKGILTISGVKNYTGEKTVEYEVAERSDLADATIKGVPESVFVTGEAIKPEIKVVYGNKILTEGTDYTVTYGENTEVGEGTVTITAVEGSVDYKGTQTVTFQIKDYDRVDLAEAKITGVPESVFVTGEAIKPEIEVVYGTKILTEGTDYTVTYGENTEVGEGTVTITAVEGSKEYTGTQTVTFQIVENKPAAPELERVDVYGNTATAVLSGEVEDADGYDYVIGTDEDCIVTKDYVKVNKNILKTETPFTYVQTGTYYAYCHAWKRVDGKKVFSDWSKAVEFEVKAVTPAQPVITNVTVKGSTVTVTYTKAEDADGYDVVLGSAVKPVNGEKRPVNYGTLVKKNIKGNTVTATFKNVPEGTYYAGLHAFNRTAEDGKKVFSPWSNTKKVTVK